MKIIYLIPFVIFFKCLVLQVDSKLDSSCGLSRVYHDKQTNTPIYVFSARKSENKWLLTVLDKKLLDYFKIDQFLFYTSKYQFYIQT